ncbi:hypothetical protein V2G26_011340 [Clonostachys chloroleuca]
MAHIHVDHPRRFDLGSELRALQAGRFSLGSDRRYQVPSQLSGLDMLQASSIDLIVPRRRVALRPSSVTTLQSGQYETSPSSRGFGLESASSPPGRADTALHVGTSVLAQCHGNTGKLQPYLYPISHRNKYKSRQECEELGMITDSAGGGASELACAEDWERPTCIPRPGGAEGKICE